MKLLNVFSSRDTIIVNGTLTTRQPIHNKPVKLSCYTGCNQFRFITDDGMITTSTVVSDDTYGKYRVIMTQNSAYVFAI